jgi:hypothetical protein
MFWSKKKVFEPTTVVNIRNAGSERNYDRYVGRDDENPYHFGNPFTHLELEHTKAIVQVKTRDESVDFYEKWLKGEIFQEIEPERRWWILKHISKLKGKRLGCYCKPQRCHGDVLAKMADAL